VSGLTVKLDENLGESHARLVRESGYECDRVTDQGLSGASDDEVWARVVVEGRFFITLDLGFSDVRQYPPGTHPGVLLLRPIDGTRDSAAAVLRKVLERHDLHDLVGCLAVADVGQTRIRRPKT
jgi:predicted nuclease of predicted toxin-antitoxin system